MNRRPLRTLGEAIAPDPVFQLREIRKRIHGPIPRVAAGGIVFRTFTGPDVWELPVLVTQVAPRYGSYWVFPKGGAEPGEQPHEAALREVEEEGGVKAKLASAKRWQSTSVFSDLGKYDVKLVMKAMKAVAKTPEEKKLVEDNKQEVCRLSFEFSNTTTYFVLKHVSGEPHPDTGHHEKPECSNDKGAAEMQAAKWVSLREARALGSKLAKVIDQLMPVIEALWKPTGGAKKGTTPNPSSSPAPSSSQPRFSATAIRSQPLNPQLPFVW